MPSGTKPKVLVIELWGVGDLALATPFLRAACERFEVTLLAKPAALELQQRFWPRVRVEPFVMPWTSFRGKYKLWRWPWARLLGLQRKLSAECFDFGVSPRWDPRDHLLLKLLGVKRRLGFPRLGSGIFLTDPLPSPHPSEEHRYELWRVAGKTLGLELPPRQEAGIPAHTRHKLVVVHSGAGQPAKIWPLENFRALVRRLREAGYVVQVLCDAAQRDWWIQSDESCVTTPKSLGELTMLLEQAGAFIGNDSGPGHVAAISGVPTFTFFGPSLPQAFAPIHPMSEWIEGGACPYKPCKDYCRFPSPRCLENTTLEAAWPRVKVFVESHLTGFSGCEAAMASSPRRAAG